MKAITGRQPWAWAIMHAGKNVEKDSEDQVGNLAEHGLGRECASDFYSPIHEQIFAAALKLDSLAALCYEHARLHPAPTSESEEGQ